MASRPFSADPGLVIGPARTGQQLEWALGGRLDLVAEDDGRGAHVDTGAGVGPRNAISRFVARYGAVARFGHGPRPFSGCRVELAQSLRAQFATA